MLGTFYVGRVDLAMYQWVEPGRKTSFGHSAVAGRAIKTQLKQPLINREGACIQVTEQAITQIARPKGNIARIFLQQACTEGWIMVRKKVNFRRQNSDACRAYCRMTLDEFEGINARQCWANWRTLPRNLNNRLPNRPLKIVDLCCGIGESTEVLAYYAAPGSQIVGLEFNPHFVTLAKTRRYLHDNAQPCNVKFRTQSVLDTFRESAGNAIAEHSMDLVNCCGAVGCHFDEKATRILAHEIKRVLHPGGLATIDSGPDGTPTGKLIGIFEGLGFQTLHRAKSCFLDRFTQVCFRKL
jgi:SAM-dependent methyltransferase